MSSSNKKAIQTAVYKATSPKDAPGKEKHIRTVVSKTFVKDGSSEQIIAALSKRLDKSHWAVVLKTLVIFHRCFKDGDPAFIDSLKNRSGVLFALRKFSTPAAQNNAYTLFVKKYAKYLEEKVSVLRLLNFQFESQKDVCKGIKPPKAFKVVPKLQSQLNALLNCKMRSQRAGINNLIKAVYILLLQDSLPIYSHLNDGISSLLELFKSMPKKDAARVVEIYKLYGKETDALISLYEVGRRFVNKLPTVHKTDVSMIDQMEAYVEKAPAGGGDYDDGMQTNMNFLMSNPGHKESESDDDAQPAGDDSSGASDSGSEDDAGGDPFAPFMTQTFSGFNFSAPTFFQPQYNTTPSFQPTTGAPNPFQTTPSPFGTPAGGAANNPFATNPFAATPVAQPNPFTTAQVGSQVSFTASQPGFGSPAPFGTTSQPGFVGSQPGFVGSQPGFGTQPFAPNPFGAPATVTVQPVANPNPFASTQPAANPFTTNNPFL